MSPQNHYGISWISLDDINATDWERENFQPTMGFDEVLKGLKEGKKYRRLSWSNDHFFILTNKRNDMDLIICTDTSSPRLYLQDLEAKDWVEVK